MFSDFISIFFSFPVKRCSISIVVFVRNYCKCYCQVMARINYNNNNSLIFKRNATHCILAFGIRRSVCVRVYVCVCVCVCVCSRLLYASPAWNGYATASKMESLKKVLFKAKHWQIVDKDYVLEELFLDCDRALFSASQSSNHCLNHLFLIKPNRVHTMSLRPRGHNFSLPLLRYELAKKSFINRSLFMYV